MPRSNSTHDLHIDPEAYPPHVRKSGLLKSGHLYDNSFANRHKLAAAGRKALATNPEYRCKAVTRSAPQRPCTLARVRGSCYCRHHIKLDDRVKLDAKRRVELEETAAKARWEGERQEAARYLEHAARRALRFHWLRIDPRVPGRTYPELTPSQHDKCVEWLAQVGYPIDAVSKISGEFPTPYTVDRSMWFAIRHLIKKTLSDNDALKKLNSAHNADRRFFARMAKAGYGPSDGVTPFNYDDVEGLIANAERASATQDDDGEA